MTLAQVLILGTVQGFTEFLPISSTAHLILLPWFFKFPDPGLTFDIALHLGTLLAILIYFRKEWIELFGMAIIGVRGAHKRAHFVGDLSTLNLLIFILIATIPGVIFGGLLESKAETIFRTPLLLAATLAVFGLILLLVDKKIGHLGNLGDLDKRKAFFIGLWQALAIIPGVSRSGATITAGLLVGLKREMAVKFSFLLSAPIIAGSVVVGVLKIPNSQLLITDFQFLAGILASFFSGILAIKFLLNFVRTNSFLPFVIYRLILAAAIIVFFLVKI